MDRLGGIDEQWDGYVAQLKSIGLDRLSSSIRPGTTGTTRARTDSHWSGYGDPRRTRPSTTKGSQTCSTSTSTTPPALVIDSSERTSQVICDAPAAQRDVLLTVRRDGLYLDGHTTWVESSGEPESTSTLSVVVWFAPHAFARGDHEGFTALIDASSDGSNGVALGHHSDGTATVRLSGSLIRTDLCIDVGRWNRICLDLGDGQARIRVGEDEALATVPDRHILIPPLVYVGRGRPRIGEEGFPSDAAIGLLHSVRLTTTAMEDSHSPTHGLQVDTAPDRRRYALDPHRPIGHLSAPQGWMNEPHAAIQVAGVHHIFYQHNAGGPYWDHICWGHATSRDLVHWRDEPIAAHPGRPEIAADGVWSGSSVLDVDGTHLLYVTAGNLRHRPDQVVGGRTPGGKPLADR